MSLGFDNAKSFYTNLEENVVISEPDYLENKEKLEKFLNISIDQHFLSWMNDEVGIIQLHTDNDARVAEFAVAIRFNDLKATQESLNYIKEQIRKKTPVKFRGIEYQGHEIHFLSIKGFFKIIFGNAFDKIDKPYYTIMEDYVVFSNTPKTLGKIIRHYNEGATLNNNKAFADYMDRFERQSTLFVYLNSEQLIADTHKFLDDESWKSLITHRNYIERFPMVGIQLKPSDNLLAHQIIFKYADRSEQTTDFNDIFAGDMPEIEILSSEEEESIAIEDILPDDLTDKVMNDFYPNGQLKYEVSLKKGMKHGRYFEYDSSGNVIIKGRYKNDEKSGNWRFYNDEGDVERKEKF